MDTSSHQVKNMLATVQSLAAQAVRSVASRDAAQAAFEARPMALARAHEMPDARLAGRRVLVVDDEMLVCLLMQEVLTDLGCVVVGPAAWIDEALALAESKALDAAVLDLNLGGHHSYPVADALAARGVPFLFLTGYSRTRDRYQDVPMLQKPITSEQLAAGIAGLLDRPMH